MINQELVNSGVNRTAPTVRMNYGIIKLRTFPLLIFSAARHQNLRLNTQNYDLMFEMVSLTPWLKIKEIKILVPQTGVLRVNTNGLNEKPKQLHNAELPALRCSSPSIVSENLLRLLRLAGRQEIPTEMPSDITKRIQET
jgi:hypothetical protein